MKQIEFNFSEEIEDVICELCGNPVELDRILKGCNICQDCEDLDNNDEDVFI